MYLLIPQGSRLIGKYASRLSLTHRSFGMVIIFCARWLCGLRLRHELCNQDCSTWQMKGVLYWKADYLVRGTPFTREALTPFSAGNRVMSECPFGTLSYHSKHHCSPVS